ncbi:hypothetical protein IC575_024373 [Cucumis melo]
MVDSQIYNIAFIDYALKKLLHLKECCYNPSKWVQVTPCKVYFCGPEVNISNRVLRRYSDYLDNFLCASFVHEELGKMYSTELSPRTSSSLEDRKMKIFKRILSILRDGITIGDKKFEFLAYSSSQLREKEDGSSRVDEKEEENADKWWLSEKAIRKAGELRREEDVVVMLPMTWQKEIEKEVRGKKTEP